MPTCETILSLMSWEPEWTPEKGVLRLKISVLKWYSFLARTSSSANFCSFKNSKHFSCSFSLVDISLSKLFDEEATCEARFSLPILLLSHKLRGIASTTSLLVRLTLFDKSVMLGHWSSAVSWLPSMSVDSELKILCLRLTLLLTSISLVVSRLLRLGNECLRLDGVLACFWLPAVCLDDDDGAGTGSSGGVLLGGSGDSFLSNVSLISVMTLFNCDGWRTLCGTHLPDLRASSTLMAHSLHV